MESLGPPKSGARRWCFSMGLIHRSARVSQMKQLFELLDEATFGLVERSPVARKPDVDLAFNEKQNAEEGSALATSFRDIRAPNVIERKIFRV